MLSAIKADLVRLSFNRERTSQMVVPATKQNTAEKIKNRAQNVHQNGLFHCHGEQEQKAFHAVVMHIVRCILIPNGAAATSKFGNH
jgi:hypothetical protein